MGKSKRNSGPKQGSNRAALMEEREAERRAIDSASSRPLEGVVGECDLVAMREFVPSATAVASSISSDRAITFATVLPGAVAGLVREEADVVSAFVGLQVQQHSGNVSGDLGAATEWAITAAPGTSLDAALVTGDSPELASLFSTGTLDVTVHQDFSWWIPESATATEEVTATVERANQAIMPSARLSGVEAAWWVHAGSKAHLRWVRPESEDELMLALARLHAAGNLTLGEGSRYAGSFRTHGLLVPVFDLDPEMHQDEWTTPTATFGDHLLEALAVDAPLTGEQVRSRDGLRGRQVTLRS